MGTPFDLFQGVNKGFWAGGAGAPVDTLTLALNALIAGGGYAGHKMGFLDKPPDLIEKPVGGSEWIAAKMRSGGLLQDNPGSTADNIGNVLGGLLGPVTAAKAPQIARGLLQGGENLAAPRTLNQQAGMIRIDGRGQIPESRSDVNKLSDRFSKLLDDAKVQYEHNKSGVSPARYFEFNNPKDVDGRFKVRLSDHRNVHGADISVDPVTGGTFEEMLQSLRDMGIPIANRVKPVSRVAMSDEVLEKIYGIPRSLMEQRGMDVEKIKSRYVFSDKGYWTEKK